jgi:transposase
MTGRGSKKARRRRQIIVFLDEFGTSFRERLGPTWAPRGRRPVIKRTDADRRALSTLAVLTISGKIYKRHVQGSICSPHVIAMLKWLLGFMPEGFVLVWDGASIHRSKLTRCFLAQHPQIAVEVLPSYAPELNAEEYSHGNVKQHLRNATPDDKGHMRRQLDQQFNRLRRRPDLLLACFHAAGLAVKQLW